MDQAKELSTKAKILLILINIMSRAKLINQPQLLGIALLIIIGIISIRKYKMLMNRIMIIII